MKDYYPYWKIITFLLMVTLMTIPGITFSASSENYQLIGSHFTEGGGKMESQRYTAITIHGHPISGFKMKSSNYALSGGFIASARPSIEAEIDIDPETLNLKSSGRWITCHITLPEGYPKEVFIPEEVALTRINGKTLDNFIFSDPEAIHSKAVDNDQYQETEDMEEFLKVKFIRSEVQAVIPIGEQVELTVTGNLKSGASFQGTGIIRVINPGKPEGKPGKKAAR